MSMGLDAQKGTKNGLGLPNLVVIQVMSVFLAAIHLIYWFYNNEV